MLIFIRKQNGVHGLVIGPIGSMSQIGVCRKLCSTKGVSLYWAILELLHILFCLILLLLSYVHVRYHFFFKPTFWRQRQTFANPYPFFSWVWQEENETKSEKIWQNLAKFESLKKSDKTKFDKSFEKMWQNLLKFDRIW